jgi:hypothetical protein
MAYSTHGYIFVCLINNLIHIQSLEMRNIDFFAVQLHKICSLNRMASHLMRAALRSIISLFLALISSYDA